MENQTCNLFLITSLRVCWVNPAGSVTILQHRLERAKEGREHERARESAGRPWILISAGFRQTGPKCFQNTCFADQQPTPTSAPDFGNYGSCYLCKLSWICWSWFFVWKFIRWFIIFFTYYTRWFSIGCFNVSMVVGHGENDCEYPKSWHFSTIFIFVNFNFPFFCKFSQNTWLLPNIEFPSTNYLQILNLWLCLLLLIEKFDMACVHGGDSCGSKLPR